VTEGQLVPQLVMVLLYCALVLVNHPVAGTAPVTLLVE
jgi:hypothetical protein